MNWQPVLILVLILIIITILLLVAENFLVSYGECKITLNKDKILTIQGGDNLLTALTNNRIFIPAACGGKATCGFCKVTVLSGAGSILPTEKPFLSPTELRMNTRLACQIKVRQDLEIKIPEDLLSAQEFKTRVQEIKDLTYDTKLFALQLIEPPTIKFKPGQYIQFKIPGTDEFRAYSIASPPHIENRVELIVRLVPGGLCSTFMHEELKIGDEIFITGPYGEFYLREESQRPIILIGGGSGMAPIRSIVYHLKESGMPRKAVFFFGARAKRDLYYTEEYRELERSFPNFRYIPALSEPKPEDDWDGEVGLITEVVDKYINDASPMEAYLCGPPPMIDAALKVLPKKGLRPERVYFDKF